MYLSKDDGVSLEKGGSVAGGLFYDNQADEERYKLSYVVGLNHGLGVENLKVEEIIFMRPIISRI